MSSTFDSSHDTAEDVAGILPPESSGPTDLPTHDELLSAIKQTDDESRLYQTRLQRAVTVARAHGISWQRIGDSLGISRQAAVSRFGSAKKRAAVDPLVKQLRTDLITRTERVFSDLDAGNYDAVQALMTWSCAQANSREKWIVRWGHYVEACGRFLGSASSSLESKDRQDVSYQNLLEHLIVGVVGHADLLFENGGWDGRVTFNEKGEIVDLDIWTN